ncbi:MAG: hypothetical protein KAU83_05650, partial [Bacteroidales bacterium]|nr:hypothetical protein [Bacteroidales bacterium]
YINCDNINIIMVFKYIINYISKKPWSLIIDFNVLNLLHLSGLIKNANLKSNILLNLTGVL